MHYYKHIHNLIHLILNNYCIVIPISARSRATSMDGLPYPNKELQKKCIKEYKRNQKKQLGGSFFHAAKVIGGGVEELAKEGE
jgi:hypothetical protein